MRVYLGELEKLFYKQVLKQEKNDYEVSMSNFRLKNRVLKTYVLQWYSCRCMESRNYFQDEESSFMKIT